MDLKPKGLLKRVVDFALSEIDRRSRPPQRFSSAPSPASAPAPEASPDAGHAVPGAPAVPREAASVSRQPAEAELPLEVTRSASGALVVRWSISDVDVDAARPLSTAEASLAVRVVAFTTDDLACVRREVLDLPAATLAGYLTLQRPGTERLVVSVGLLAAERFVSIVHAQLG